LKAGGIVVEEAAPEDPPELRRLLRDNPMEGEIRVSLEREPDAFLAAAVEGEPHRTIVARDSGVGGIVGMGSRAVWNAFVNGEPCRLGYLSQLRVDRAHRGQKRLLKDGYALIRSFRGADEKPFDLTSIVADNEVARRLLGAGVPGLPQYREIAEWSTLVVPTTARSRRGMEIVRGTADLLDGIAACLERNRCRYQFAPRFSETDLRSPERSRGLKPEDFFVTLSRGEIVGCVALWDQSAFKQVVVRGYAPRLARWRPWINRINRLAPLLGTPRLPEPGQRLPHAYLSHLAVDGDDPGIFQALVEAAYTEAKERRYVYMVIGLAARHPWRSWLERRFKPRTYSSVLYVVFWEDGAEAVARLDGRMLHVEVALL